MNLSSQDGKILIVVVSIVIMVMVIGSFLLPAPLKVGDLVRIEPIHNENNVLVDIGKIYMIEGRWLHIHPIVDNKETSECWKITSCEVLERIPPKS